MSESSDTEGFKALAQAMELDISDKNEEEAENQEKEIPKVAEVEKKKRPKNKKKKRSSMFRRNPINARLQALEGAERIKLLDKALFGDKEELVRNMRATNSTDYEIVFLGKINPVISPEEEISPEESKQAAWYDSDDDDKDNNQIKKKFEKLTGSNPTWADFNQKKIVDSDSDEDVITKSVGFLAKDETTSVHPKSVLPYKRVKNLNRTTQQESRITAVEFHPTSQVGIVAGLNGMVSMFAVDGEENRKIYNIKYEKFSISSCKLYDNELVVGGKRDHFHVYDLMSGDKQRIRLPTGISNLKTFEVSTCGKFMAVIGDCGELHIMHRLTKEHICTMKQEYQSTSVKFSTDSNHLFSHSDDNEVSIFDLRTQRLVHRFVDDGCVNGTALSIGGKMIATGSRQGFVNIYETEDVFVSKNPKPIKTIDNLKTEITDMVFNPSVELLGICSVDAINAVKMVHFPSATVFDNFPNAHDEFGCPTTLAFSPGSGYLALGTAASVVPLYRMRHFKNY